MRLAKYIIVLLLLPLTALKHDFYVSITTAKWNTQSKTWQVSIKLFRDDVELALEKQSGVRVKFEIPNAQVDSLLADWVLQGFSITQGQAPVSFTFLGKEAEPELLWVYLESKPGQSPQKIEVTNTLLMRQFEDQTNLVHLEAGKRKASLFLRNSDPSQVVEL